MPLDESMLGVRVSVRSRVPGERGPTGGPAMTDVIGRVVAVDADYARVERRDGSLVDVRLADVVTARRVPDGPQRARTRSASAYSVDELTRICTRGWPPTESEPLGEWLLRAAGGFTGRANSVAVHGEPGLDFAAAIERVIAYYTDRGLP
ncbi:MAG: GNAT family N-acetyltransferase, cg3035/Rv0428c family, partial [Nocardioidaceae bacterium]